MVTLDAGLIVAAIIVPIILLVANLVMLAKYIDPQHAAGHYTAKFILVGSAPKPLVIPCRPPALVLPVPRPSVAWFCGGSGHFIACVCMLERVWDVVRRCGGSRGAVSCCCCDGYGGLFG